MATLFKIAIFLFATLSIFPVFFGCKKCAECTFTDSRTGVVMRDTICGSGKDYDNSYQVYQKAGWQCVEK